MDLTWTSHDIRRSADFRANVRVLRTVPVLPGKCKNHCRPKQTNEPSRGKSKPRYGKVSIQYSTFAEPSGNLTVHQCGCIASSIERVRRSRANPARFRDFEHPLTEHALSPGSTNPVSSVLVWTWHMLCYLLRSYTTWPSFKARGERAVRCGTVRYGTHNMTCRVFLQQIRTYKRTDLSSKIFVR